MVRVLFLIAFSFFVLMVPSFCSSEAEYKKEGFFQVYDDVRRMDLVARFLPYNPKIFIVNPTPEIINDCSKQWPQGTISTKISDLSKHEREPVFLWLNSENTELKQLKKLKDTLQNVSVIYTTTSTIPGSKSHYQNLRIFLEQQNFTLLAHWYWEGKGGHAVFLKNDIYDTMMRSLNHSLADYKALPPKFVTPLEKYLKKIDHKPISGHSFGQIDYMYIINLDERPEKFNKCIEQLHPYGVKPFRFSAVNGWRLSNKVLNEVGLKFFPGMTTGKFMGTVYREIGGSEFISNEMIQQEETAYFSLGMSRGAIGIVLSHLSVLQDAYNSGYKTIWVMEDDVQVLEDPRQIPALIEKLDQIDEEWDILFTDRDSKDKQGNYVPCRALAMRPNHNMEPLEAFLSRIYPVSYDFSRTSMRYGAYSMIIRRSGIEKILHYFKNYSIFLPYDMDFWLIPTLKMYHTNRDIVSTIPTALSDNYRPYYLEKK